MKKLLIACLLFSIISIGPVYGAPDGFTPARLSPQDRADTIRMEAYLNGLKNISANFMQIDDAGGIMRGHIDIARPGKMRVSYDPPSKDFIIADGESVHIWNNDLQEQTNIDQGSSLAEFILRDPIKLEGEIMITRFKRFPSKMELTLAESNDPSAGQLTLVFEDNPLKLRQWKVTDPQGHTTGVNLENLEYDVTFSPRIFQYHPPNFGQNKHSQIP